MDADLKELQIQIIHQISRNLGQALNLDQALESIHGVLSRSMALKSAQIILKDPETGRLRGYPARDLPPEAQPPAGFPLQDRIVELAMETAQPFFLPVRGQEPIFLHQTRTRPIPKEQLAFIGVPLILQGFPVGVLGVDRLFGDEVHLEEDLRFLSVIAALLGQFLGEERRSRLPEEGRLPGPPALGPEPSEEFGNSFLVGQSPVILEIQRVLQKIAAGRSPVLLIGESGSGKTLMARLIHELSPRVRYPFLKLNCASMPENLLAVELFGYEKDAVPGAGKARPGRLEEADGGDIFLKEIGALPLNLQARLVSYLQKMEFLRLGGSRPRKVDVRLLADTTEDLSNAVTTGSFREDLYYLLHHSPVWVPPLRERRQDIPLLLDHFLDKVSKEYGRRFYLTQKALEVLEDYHWPGNVREMENLVERRCILLEGAEIDVQDLPAYLAPAAKASLAADQAFLPRLKEMEKKEILAALERNRWIQSQAAMDLGLTLRQIGYRVKQFGLEKLIKENRGQARSSYRKGESPLDSRPY